MMTPYGPIGPDGYIHRSFTLYSRKASMKNLPEQVSLTFGWSREAPRKLVYPHPKELDRYLPVFAGEYVSQSAAMDLTVDQIAEAIRLRAEGPPDSLPEGWEEASYAHGGKMTFQAVRELSPIRSILVRRDSEGKAHIYVDRPTAADLADVPAVVAWLDRRAAR